MTKTIGIDVNRVGHSTGDLDLTSPILNLGFELVLARLIFPAAEGR